MPGPSIAVDAVDVGAAERRLHKRARLRRVFNGADRNGDGTLDASELLAAFRAVDDPELCGVSEEAVAWVMALFDVDGSSRLEMDEFMAVFDTLKLKTVFDAMDSDGSGVISRDELVAALSQLGFDPSPAQVSAMVASIDTDDDGGVDFAEFQAFFGALDNLSLEAISFHLLESAAVSVGNDFVPDLPPAYVSYWKFLAAGAAGGSSSKTVTAPLQRIQLLQQSATGEAQSTLAVGRAILRRAGWAGLFRGNAANLAQAIPFTGLVCLTYSQLCRAQPTRPGHDPADPWPLWHLGSGAVAATAATVLTYPLDVVRAHMSTQTKGTGSVYDASIGASARRLYTAGGVRALYHGLIPTLGSIAPFVALQLSVYDSLKTFVPPLVPGMDNAHRSVGFSTACGAAAGTTALVATYPIDLVRRRLQLDAYGYTSSLHAARSIVAADGLRGLFRGVVPAALKIAPAVATGLVVRDAVLSSVEA